MNLGAGEDLYVLFAGVLTMRPWNKIVQQGINHLKLDGTNEDKSEIQVCSFPCFSVQNLRFILDSLVAIFIVIICL